MSANEIFGILYGAVFAGDWSDRNMAAARAGVIAVARALGAAAGRAASDAFRSAYGVSIATPLTLLWGNDGTEHGVNVSGECAGITAGACTSSSRLINFASLSEEASPNRPESMAFISARNNVVHELGHALANRFWSRNGATGESVYSATGPYSVVGLNANRDLREDPGGFYPSPVSASRTWRQHPGPDGHEVFADMFLGWTFGAWGTDSMGARRATFMTTNMSEWITEASSR